VLSGRDVGVFILEYLSVMDTHDPLGTPIIPFLQFLLHDGQRVGFVMQYDPNRLAALRAIFQEHRGVWRKPSRAWVVPKGAALEVIAALDELDPQRYPAARSEAFLAKAVQHPRPFVAPQLDLQIQPLVDGRHALRFAYDPVLVVLLRTLRGSWHKPWWVVDLPLDRLQGFLQTAGAIPPDMVTIHADLWELLEGGALQPTGMLHVEEGEVEDGRGDAAAFAGYAPEGPAVLVPLITALSLFSVNPDQVRTMAEAYALYPYQSEGLHFLLARSTALLADDMGLGKTRQAIVGALALLEAEKDGDGHPFPRRVLIVCPASLKRNWEAELQAVGIPGTAIARVESLAEARAVDRLAVQASDSAQAPLHPEVPRFVIVNYELLRVLEGDYLLAIFDEAHYLKEPGARRTQEAFRLAQRIPRRWLLTATPILNREEELWTLLRLGGHPMGALSLPAFRTLYADEAEQRALLGARLQEWMLRRHKSEVLSLPGKYHQTIPVDPDPDWLAAYQDIRDNDYLRAIEKIGRMRILLEQGKREAVLDLLESLQESAKALVFCQYRETVRWFAEQLGDAAVTLTGALTGKARDRAIQRFQQEDSVRWMVATIDTAGVGLNLTAASYVFFVSRPWTPAAQDQAEDRAYRIGQNRRVEIYLPLIAGTIDSDIAALLDAKRAVSEGVLGEMLAARDAAPGLGGEAKGRVRMLPAHIRTAEPDGSS